MGATRDHVLLELDGHEVRFSNPEKVFFPARGHTKLDLCSYYLEVADACLAHLRDRPTTMKRFRDGVEGEFFFQKRVPPNAPEWLEQMVLAFPSGRTANFLVCQDRAQMAWALNLGVIDWNPWPIRRPHTHHPDELRVDLDPTPEASFGDVRAVALLAWDEVPDADPRELRLDTVPSRLAEVGDRSAGMDDNAGSLDALLELAARDERDGLGDAPWPPHFPKQRGEGRRVAPSRARKG